MQWRYGGPNVSGARDLQFGGVFSTLFLLMCVIAPFFLKHIEEEFHLICSKPIKITKRNPKPWIISQGGR
jgi:hypothetical protein